MKIGVTMYHDERSDEFWSATNPGGMSTATSFPARVPLVDPFAIPLANGLQAANDGVVAMGLGGAFAPPRLLLKPFGYGEPTQTFMMQVYHWKATSGNLWLNTGGQQHREWIPSLLAAYTCTLGTVPGIGPPSQGLDVPNIYYFCSAIVQTFGPTVVAGSFQEDVFTLNGGIVTACIRAMGARRIEVLFANVSTAGANCLWGKW